MTSKMVKIMTKEQDELFKICNDVATICGLEPPLREHQFHPLRRWRFDYALVDVHIAVELDGGVWVSGRHNRGSGYVKDMEKFNEAAILGWKILRFTPADVKQGKPYEIITRAIAAYKQRVRSFADYRTD